MHYISTKEAGEMWGISSRRVSKLCFEGRIQGAKKIKGKWLIPDYTEKPIDKRVKENKKISTNINIDNYYKNLEKMFMTILPESNNATYKSKLNYSDDLEKPRQRWYRYKEGYSLDLVKSIINMEGENSSMLILDPFLGSGTTLLAANSLGHEGIGFEVNPFSCFLSKLKLYNYNYIEIEEYREASSKIMDKQNWKNLKFEYPKLSISKKVLDENISSDFLKIKEYIYILETSDKIKELLLLGWLAVLEEIAVYRKAGNGLKKKKKTMKLDLEDVLKLLNQQYNLILKDIMDNTIEFNSKIFKDTSLNIDKYIESNSIDGAIFSPPYANCFDYTEIYKLELWFGDFIKEYPDLKVLRQKSLTSHLNGLKTILNAEDLNDQDPLKPLILELEKQKLWDNKIPSMIIMYFEEMKILLKNIFNVLKPDGFCSIIIGNSVYGGIVFPTDLLIATYAKEIGFNVEKIEVDRYIITSSQQYEKTKKNKRLIRESIICLRK